LYQEIKSFGFESFRVMRKVAILKFITGVMSILHTLVTLQTSRLRLHSILADAALLFLCRSRKITRLCFGGTKIFYEFLLSMQLRFPDLFSNFSLILAINSFSS
jgi:hypothetical protein